MSESFFYFVGTYFTIVILLFILGCLYIEPHLPEVSIVEFSVPAFNNTSDGQTISGIHVDLKIRNLNKAIGLYVDDPSSLAVSYNSPEEPYQRYAWVSTIPPFYQGNGKTKHVKTQTHLQQPSIVVVDENERIIEQLVESKHGLQVPEKAVPVINLRVKLIVSYRLKLLWDSSPHQLEVGADVMVYANTGEMISKGSFLLV